MASKLRGFVRASILIGLMLTVLPLVIFAWAIRFDRLRLRFVSWFYKIAAYFMGLRIHVRGELSKHRPLMLVSNHSSYLDVFVIGSKIPVSFTPKKEIRSWPVIGFMAVLADCIFVERRPREMEAASREMEKRLKKGKILCLFPEGTTSDGKHIKPFKSGFLNLAYSHHMPVQPASIAYTHIGNQPITDARREEIAWVGEATFFSHFWHFMTLPSVRVEVILHEAKTIAEYDDRKALTHACEQEIITNVTRMLEAAHAY